MFPRWSCKWQLAELCTCANHTTVCSKTEQAHHRLKLVATGQSNPCVQRYNNPANVYVYLKIFWEILNFSLIHLPYQDLKRHFGFTRTNWKTGPSENTSQEVRTMTEQLRYLVSVYRYLNIKVNFIQIFKLKVILYLFDISLM